MPLYEFRCLECQEVFEILVIKSDDQKEMKCPKCGAENFERVMSAAAFAMGDSGSSSNVSTQSRSCSGGSCTTWDLPGHSK